MLSSRRVCATRWFSRAQTHTKKLDAHLQLLLRALRGERAPELGLFLRARERGIRASGAAPHETTAREGRDAKPRRDAEARAADADHVAQEAKGDAERREELNQALRARAQAADAAASAAEAREQASNARAAAAERRAAQAEAALGAAKPVAAYIGDYAHDNNWNGAAPGASLSLTPAQLGVHRALYCWRDAVARAHRASAARRDRRRSDGGS